MKIRFLYFFIMKRYTDVRVDRCIYLMHEEIAARLLKRAIRTYRKLKKISDKHGASNTSELLDGIKSGKFAEHPTYEDYLEARSYELELEKILKKLNSAIVETQRALSRA